MYVVTVPVCIARYVHARITESCMNVRTMYIVHSYVHMDDFGYIVI